MWVCDGRQDMIGLYIPILVLSHLLPFGTFGSRRVNEPGGNQRFALMKNGPQIHRKLQLCRLIARRFKLNPVRALRLSPDDGLHA